MMLKCKKCGFENQLGSIFCRGCGEKLDTSSLDHPESIDMNAKKKGKGPSKVIAVVAVLVVVIILLGAGIAFGLLSIPKNSAYQESKLDVEKIVSSIRRGRDVSMSPKELSAWVQQYVCPIEGINGVWFDGSGDKLTMYVFANQNGREIVISATGTLTKGIGKEKVKFDVESYKQGYVPLFCCQETAKKLCEKVLDCDRIEDVFEKAESASFRSGKLTIKFPSKAGRKNREKAK